MAIAHCCDCFDGLGDMRTGLVRFAMEQERENNSGR